MLTTNEAERLMIPHDECTPFQKALVTNSTDAAYAAIPPTTTEPTGAGVIPIVSIVGHSSPINLLVMPYVLGSDGQTCSCRVTGWMKIQGTIGTLWVPTVLGEYDCIGCLSVGVAGSDVLNTERFVDTLALVANMATDNQGTTKVSPADDTPGHFMVKIKGFQKVQIQFKKGTSTSANALYKTV